MTRRWSLVLLLLAGVFAGLRGVHALAEQPEDSAIFTDRVVVIGVTGRYELSSTDRAVLGTHLEDAQAGAVSVRPRYIGDCAAAGWATLGAGRRTGVGGLCSPVVSGSQVVDWPARLAAAAAHHGDAQLGTLAASVPGCVAAVGPGAALAAARPDGSLARFETVPAFVASGARTSCPITLVDAGPASDQLIDTVAKQRDVTLIVSGIGPPAGSDNPGLQVVYRLGTTFPGWLTSASTRREGVVTLPDLTRTVIDVGQRAGPSASAPIDGAPFQVDPATLSVTAIRHHLDSLTALSNSVLVGDAALGIGGAAIALVIVTGLALGRFSYSRLGFAVATILSAAMMLTGAIAWNQSSAPGLFLSLLVWLWVIICTSAAMLLSRRVKVPVAVAAAALTVAAFTVDAALGGVMEPGSMLNSRPINGGRWYGFGNVTFGAYAAAGLLLAGYLAASFQRARRPHAALTAVGIVGFGIVGCEGWPSMGADFGGVIALTPALLWMMLVLSGVRVTAVKIVVVGASALIAIAAISWLDWLRGPEKRSHLGNFVQRIIDGDAQDVVIRKAVAAAESTVSLMGICSLIGGIVCWLVIFRYLLPILVDDFHTLRIVAVAALATAILGTLLNDGGISVWLMLTATFSASMASLWLDRVVADGRLTWDRSANR